MLTFQRFKTTEELKDKRRTKNVSYKPRAHFQLLDPLIHARVIKIHIHAWRIKPCMSLEVFACDSGMVAQVTGVYESLFRLKIQMIDLNYFWTTFSGYLLRRPFTAKGNFTKLLNPELSNEI